MIMRLNAAHDIRSASRPNVIRDIRCLPTECQTGRRLNVIRDIRCLPTECQTGRRLNVKRASDRMSWVTQLQEYKQQGSKSTVPILARSASPRGGEAARTSRTQRSVTMPKSRLSVLWDQGHLADVEDELEQLLDPDDLERNVIDGMLQSGMHPKAVINKITKDRGWQ